MILLNHKPLVIKVLILFLAYTLTIFFNENFLSDVLSEFPELGDKSDIQYSNPNEIKLASRGEQKFGPKTKLLMHFLNSEPFLMFLSELSGITNLIADPYFEGGGCHQIKPGGMLKNTCRFQ